MATSSMKSRVDSVQDMREKRSAPAFTEASTSPHRQAKQSILRSIPVDPRYTFDLSHAIQRAWSTEITCSAHFSLHSATGALPPPPSPLPRKPLAFHLSQPSALLASTPARPTDPQLASPLFAKLPPEVREQIWQHLLTAPYLVLCVAGGGLPPTNHSRHLQPAILRTSRRCFLEAAPVLYGRNAFSVAHIPNLLRSRAAPPRFVLAPRYFPLLRRVNVDVPDKFIDRWYWTAWGDEYESYMSVVAALVQMAGAGLRHLQLSLVRNCALESYTSWGPYVAADSPLMRAVAESFLKGGCGDRRRFLLVVPCGGGGAGASGDGRGGGGSGGGGEPLRAFDVLREDAPAVIHALARNLGRLQKTARMNGLELEESLYVRVKGELPESCGSLFEEARAEIVVDEDCDAFGEKRSKGIALEVSY